MVHTESSIRSKSHFKFWSWTMHRWIYILCNAKI
jgi:hypothetical protein